MLFPFCDMVLIKKENYAIKKSLYTFLHEQLGSTPNPLSCLCFKIFRDQSCWTVVEYFDQINKF